MYFKEFPVLLYPFMIGGNRTLKAVKDITLNVRAIKAVQDNVMLYDEYLVGDGDTPEIIAERLYGDPNLHWTIMLVNQRYDYINDFPVTDATLESIVAEKYGAGNRDAQHSLFGRPHYEDPDGNVVDADAPFAQAVSNYDYEVKLNEAKRSIKVINPSVIASFVRDIKEAFKTNV